MKLARIFLALCLFLSAGALSAADGPGPDIPQATGEPHPEGNDYMRRWHMEMLKHDRDVTMYLGVRPTDNSLAECFECHTVKDEAGTPVTVEDERHFCRACHDYAAVRVDCFDCHRSTPADFDEPAPHAMILRGPRFRSWGADDPDVLLAYLSKVMTEPN